MKITVITVSYNSAATIADTLRSVAQQDYPDIEYLVIDGGSTDATLDLVARSAAKPARVVSEPDRGIYDAMNKGLALATGELVGFLNSDDLYADAGAVSAIAAPFADPGVQCAFGDLDMVRRDDPARVTRAWRSGPFVPGLFASGWHPAHPTFYVRTAALRAHGGGFDTSLAISADYEMMLRLLERHRLASAHIPRVLVKMREGGMGNRSLRNIYQGNRECVAAWRINGLPSGAAILWRKPLGKLKQLRFFGTRP